MSQRDEKVRLRHMLDAAREAMALVANRPRSEIDDSRVLQLALARLIEVVGETASRVDRGTRELHPEVPWAAAVAMRNRIVHGYESVDVDIVRGTVETDLPDLVAKLERILESAGG